MASLLNVTETQVTYSCVRQAQLTVIIRKYCAYLVLTWCGLALRSTRMTRPRVQRTSP